MSEAPLPRWKAALILLTFFLLGLGCLWVPFRGLLDFVSLVNENADVVGFDKGEGYLVGAGVALLALLPDGVCDALLRRELSKRLRAWVTRTAVLGIALIVILPFLAEYKVSNVLLSKGYQACEKQPVGWLFFRTILYTNSTDAGDCGVQ